MSLSYSNGNADLNALLESDIDFRARLNQLKEATANHERALADLSLGKDAKTAREEALHLKVEMERSTTLHTQDLERETREHRDRLAKWLDKTQAEHAGLIAQAQQELASAGQKHDAAKATLQEAETVLAKAKAEAAAILADARARVARSDELLKSLGA
jgi:hypothetical protein